MFKVTIDETNDILKEISHKFGIDLDGMALSSLRFKISRFCKDHPFHTPRSFILNLVDDPGLLESFIQSILSGAPEMFRDPELWVELRDNILPGIAQDSVAGTILIPDCISGEEFFSTCILLKESGLDEQFSIRATCNHHFIRNQIQNRPLDKARYSICQQNYSLFNPGSSLDKYFKPLDGKYYYNPGMFDPGSLIVQPDHSDAVSAHHKLILYRNRMLYQNLETSRQGISKLLDQAAEGTIFVIGIKESPGNLRIENRVRFISSDLKILSKTG